MKKILLYLLTLICILGCFSGCKQNDLNKKDDKTESYYVDNHWSMYYEDLNETKSITVSEVTGENIAFSFETGAMKGSLDIKIKDDKGNICYQKTDIKTSKFTETISNPGKFTVEVTGKNHQGYFSILWNGK